MDAVQVNHGAVVTQEVENLWNEYPPPSAAREQLPEESESASGETRSRRDGPLLEVAREPAESVLFHSQAVCVTDFELCADHPDFGRERQVGTPRITFPRRQCELLAEGHPPFIADSTRAVFFDDGVVYRQRAIDPLGTRATVIHMRAEAIVELLEERRNIGAANDEASFLDISAPIEPRLHQESVALARWLASGNPFDFDAAEEATLNLVARTLAGAGAAWRRSARKPRVAARQLEMIAFVKQHVRKNLGQKMSIRDLSALLNVSPFYLCRFFKSVTGQTVYQYQLQVRLTRALDLLPEYKGNLAALAAELGFSSHSHLTTLFKRTYGYNPGSSPRPRNTKGLLTARPSLDHSAEEPWRE